MFQIYCTSDPFLNNFSWAFFPHHSTKTAFLNVLSDLPIAKFKLSSHSLAFPSFSFPAAVRSFVHFLFLEMSSSAGFQDPQSLGSSSSLAAHVFTVFFSRSSSPGSPNVGPPPDSPLILCSIYPPPGPWL